VLSTVKVLTALPFRVTDPGVLTEPLRDRLPWPQLAWPEKVWPAAGGHGGDATGDTKEQVVPISGTVSEVRKTPAPLNARFSEVPDGFHCSVEELPVELTTKVVTDGMGTVVEVLPDVMVEVPTDV
jgi:hypothetical protein